MTDQTPPILPTDEAALVPEQVSGEAPTSVAEPSAGERSERPTNVPEKFWDAELSAVRTDALLKSYLELEKRLSSGDAVAAASDDADGPDEAEAADADAPTAVPGTPEDYQIETSSDVVGVDPEINRRLHEAGFTQDQAQLVYRLAEEYLLPAVSDAYGEVFVQQEVGRLADAFGGAEAWQATADQLRTWGKANLAQDVYETLASNYDGVMAMHQMMQAREPSVVHADASGAPGDEGGLRRMMQDPRYWRDRDPAFIAEVTRGFERLFRA